MRGENLSFEDAVVHLRRISHQWEAILLGAILAVLAMLLLRAAPAALGLRIPSSIRLMA